MEFINNIKPLVDLLSSLTSPIVAITVGYIAYQQWRINVSKAAKENQREKIEIYMSISRFLHDVASTQRVDAKLFKDFEEAVALADFVFDKEITEWLFEVQCEGGAWLNINTIINLPDNPTTLSELKQEKKHMEDSIERLQQANCELFDLFKSRIIQIG